MKRDGMEAHVGNWFLIYRGDWVTLVNEIMIAFIDIVK